MFLKYLIFKRVVYWSELSNLKILTNIGQEQGKVLEPNKLNIYDPLCKTYV